MILAHKIEDDRYRIDATWPYETYQRRGSLKGVGAQWVKTTPYNGHWEATDEQVKALHIEKAIWVDATTCHEKDNVMFIPESKAVVGNRVEAFCGLCDSSFTATILDVIGESWRKDI